MHVTKAIVFFLAACPLLTAQAPVSAYRALGQRDLRQSGLNLVEGLELSAPTGVALDTRGGQVRIYVADTGNHRILRLSRG